MNRPIIASAAFSALVALAACSEPAATPPSPLRPADPKIAALYAQTCEACHSHPGSGAPQTGDARAWAPRMAQGMDVLLDHTLGGYQGMPPLGSCMDCTEDEFAALIRYMAQTS